MTVSTVSTTAALEVALVHAHAGDVIDLAPGTYAGVSLYNIKPTGTVTIQSQNSAHQAVITGMTVGNSSNLSFNRLVVDASSVVPPTPQDGNLWDVTIANSSNINMNYITAHGSAGVSLNNAISAVNFEHDTNVAINHSTFQDFHHAVQDYENNGFTASYNSFSLIYDDGIRNGGSSNVNIQHNTFTDFHMDPTDLDHPDTIQFWTNGETTSASNIYIAYNNYTRGAGNPVQGIFMRDEVGTLPYLNVNIIGNNYAGALYSGIRVIDGHGVNVNNNILTSYTDMWSGLVAQDVNGGSVIGNHSFNFQYISDQNLTISGNLVTPEVASPGVAVIPLADQQAMAAAFGMPTQQAALGHFGLPSLAPLAAPEPATWACLILGFALAGALFRIQRFAASRTKVASALPMAY